MTRTTAVRATLLAASLIVTFASGAAAATPADGFRNQQDYAYADQLIRLDECVQVEAWTALVAGDQLKNPINGGAPGPWSDVTVVLRLHDVCAGTGTELSGFAFAPPTITRLETAAVGPFAVTVVDPTGTIEAEVTGQFEWAVAGPAATATSHDIGQWHFRSDRRAPADASGGLVVADSDGDFLPGGIELGQSTIFDASIGWANEIVLCCT